MGPYFNLEEACIIIFQLGLHSCSFSRHPIVLQETLVVTTGNPVGVRKLHKNWFWMPRNEDGWWEHGRNGRCEINSRRMGVMHGLMTLEL